MQKQFYFGREIGTSNRSSMTKYSLPQRLYIGPTSMDTEMAFLMCNMAKARDGDCFPAFSDFTFLTKLR